MYVNADITLHCAARFGQNMAHCFSCVFWGKRCSVSYVRNMYVHTHTLRRTHALACTHTHTHTHTHVSHTHHTRTHTHTPHTHSLCGTSHFNTGVSTSKHSGQSRKFRSKGTQMMMMIILYFS